MTFYQNRIVDDKFFGNIIEIDYAISYIILLFSITFSGRVALFKG